MSLPLDDRILTERPTKSISRVSAVLGKHVVERLKFIVQIDSSFYKECCPLEALPHSENDNSEFGP